MTDTGLSMCTCALHAFTDWFVYVRAAFFYRLVCSGAVIRDGKQSGVFFLKHGQGLLEHNDIARNAFAGVEIKSDCSPVLRHNRIHAGKQNGVCILLVAAARVLFACASVCACIFVSMFA